MTSNVVNFPANKSSKRRLVPGRLRDARLAVCMNQTDLARAINVTRQAVSGYEQGTRTPEPETMSLILNVLGQPLGYFVTDELPEFGNRSSLNLRAVGPSTKRRNMACEVVGKWFTQTAKYFDNFVNYPEVDVPSASTLSDSGRYEPEELEDAAELCRKQWGLGVGPISNIVALLEAKGIIVARCRIDHEQIEAFSFWSGDRPFILLASEKESAARSRFDAAHELGHLILHRWIGQEELEDPKTLRLIEREADYFASAFLLPRQSFPNEVFTTRLDAFVELKKRWKVSIQAMVYRCKSLGVFDEDQVTNLYKQISARRWRKREPLDDLRVMALEQPKLLSRATEMIIKAGKKMNDEIASDLVIARRYIEAFCNLPRNFFSSENIQEFSPTLK